MSRVARTIGPRRPNCGQWPGASRRPPAMWSPWTDGGQCSNFSAHAASVWSAALILMRYGQRVADALQPRPWWRDRTEAERSAAAGSQAAMLPASKATDGITTVTTTWRRLTRRISQRWVTESMFESELPAGRYRVPRHHGSAGAEHTSSATRGRFAAPRSIHRSTGRTPPPPTRSAGQRAAGFSVRRQSAAHDHP